MSSLFPQEEAAAAAVVKGDSIGVFTSDIHHGTNEKRVFVACLCFGGRPFSSDNQHLEIWGHVSGPYTFLKADHSFVVLTGVREKD